MTLSANDVERLIKAAEDSLFPRFWGCLITASRTAGLSPLRLLSPKGPGRVAECVRRDVEALRSCPCPFDLTGSAWGHKAMLEAFREIAVRAGIDGAETLEFVDLYSKAESHVKEQDHPH